MTSPVRGMAPPMRLRQDGVVVDSLNPSRESPTLRRGTPRAAVKSGSAKAATPLEQSAQRPGPGAGEPLGSQLLNATERERERIARELHDGLGSSLKAVMLSMHNVLRHSGASRLTMLFKRHAGRWLLRVSDNGCGFDPSATRSGHGVLAMQHRARTIGGRLTIKSKPGAGTQVICVASAEEQGCACLPRVMTGTRTPISFPEVPR